MAKEGLHLNLYKVPGTANVYRCDIKLNTSRNGEGVTIRGTSEDDHDEAALMGSWWSWAKKKLKPAGQALARARKAATALLTNPVAAAAFPEYVGPALLALKAVEKATSHGKLSDVAKQLKDPVLKKLCKELHEMQTGKRTAMSGGGVLLACDPSMRGSGPRTQQERFIPNGNGARGPFGLPPGAAHPWAEYVRDQIARGQSIDPLTIRKLARMQQYQRRVARSQR